MRQDAQYNRSVQMRGQIRRRFIRWRVGHEARLTVENSAVPVSCQLEDLSLKGMRLSLGVELKENKAIKLRLECSEELVLEIEAWVAWHKMDQDFHSYGLFFTRISDAQKDKIYLFMRKYFSDEVTRRWHNEAEGDGKDKTMEDRRVFERFPANISLHYINLDSRSEGDAQTHDVSAKGLCLVTNQELKPNTALELWLHSPDRAEPFYTRGEVTWSEMTGPGTCQAGVNLEHIDFMGMSRLLKL